MNITDIVAALVAVGLCVAPLSSTYGAKKSVGLTVSGVAVALDGDTLLLNGKRIRLWGIDTPEMSDPRGPVARAALDDFLELTKGLVTCEAKDRDRYKRMVAVCTSGKLGMGNDLGRLMISSGRAFSYRIYTLKYMEAETRARKQGRGFWAKD